MGTQLQACSLPSRLLVKGFVLNVDLLPLSDLYVEH